MHIFISSGEVSGSRLAVLLIRELRSLRPDMRISALGTAALQETGAEVWTDPSAHASVGYLEPLLQALPAWLQRRRVLARLKREPPDLVLCIDAPRFNLPLLRAAHRQGLRTAYYVLPQDYLWHYRPTAQRIIHNSDLIMAINPAADNFYRQLGAQPRFVGHPVLDFLENDGDGAGLLQELGLSPQQPLLGLFLGSRRQELQRVAPIIMRGAALLREALPEAVFVVPVSAERYHARIMRLATACQLPIHTIPGRESTRLMRVAHCIISKAGTTTLEATVRACPMLLAYRVHPLTYWLATHFFRIQDRISFIGLPNLIAGKQVVPELVQTALTPERIRDEVLDLLHNRERVRRELVQVRKRLGEPGASRRAAEAVLDFMAVSHVE